MSSIFISHSSKDNQFAEDLRKQLEQRGHNSIFLDFDPQQGIPAGTNWEQILYAKLRACQGVIVLCSPDSMSSKWVFAEITHARSQGKHIFPLKISECEPVSILNDTQIIDFTTEQNLERLWQGIEAANLDSEFSWDSKRSPYPGLTAFQEKDAAVFFGRKTEIQNGIEQLNSLRQSSGDRLVLYLGASGSGKSSLVRAGILPRLKRESERWLVIDPFRPNEGLANPMDNLVGVLEDAFKPTKSPISEEDIKKILLETIPNEPHGLLKLAHRYVKAQDQRDATVLLVIDQFEELLIGNSSTSENKINRDQHKKFLAWLGEALVASQEIPSCQLLVLATMRSDFLTEYQRCEELQNVQTLQVSVKTIPKANFGELIEAPAQKAGIELEPGLVPQILEDVGTENALPLLAYTLSELWKGYGDDYKLELKEYEQLGGVKGSIEKKANEVLQDKNFESKEIEGHLKQAFLKLVQINDADKYIRKRAKKSDIPSDALPYLEKLVKNRLLYKDEETQEPIYEVSHEAIFSVWDRLNGWLEENEEFLIWRRRFDESYKTYIDGKRDDGLLLNGTMLSQSLDWQNQLGEQAQDQKEFIRLSDRKQKRAKRILQGVTFGAVIFGITSSYLWIDSFISSQKAQFEAQASSIKVQLSLNNDIENLLESLELAGNNQKFNNRWFWFPQRWFQPKNKLLPEVQSAFYQAVEASRNRARSTFDRHEDIVTSVAFSPDGQYLVSGGLEGTLKLWDVAQQSVLTTFEGHEERVMSIAFSPNGQYLVSGGLEGTLKLWTVDQQSALTIMDQASTHKTFEGHEEDIVTSIAVSPNGQYLVSGGLYGALKLWEIDQQSVLKTFEGHEKYIVAPMVVIPNYVTSVAFSSDGQYLVSGTQDGELKLWDVDQQSAIKTFEGHRGSVNSVAFSPDGQYLVSGSQDETLKLWDVDQQSELKTFESPENSSVTSVAFSPDGQYLVSGISDRTLKLWDVAQQSEFKTFKINEDEDIVASIAFSPDGQSLVSASLDGPLKLWDVTQPSVPKTFEGHERPATSVAFSPDGQYFVSGSSYRELKLWNVDQKSALQTFDGHENSVNSVVFGPNGQYLVSGGDDESVDTLGKALKIWNVDQKSAIQTFEVHENSSLTTVVTSVAFSPDGQYLVSGSQDRTLKLWDVDQQSAIKTFKGESPVRSLAFGPDGQYIFSGSLDGTIKLWLGADWKVWAKAACKRERLHPTLVAGEIDAAPRAAKVCIDYEFWTEEEKTRFDSKKAESLVKQGLALAEEGDAKQAKKYIQQAYKLDAENVDLVERETEVNQLTAKALIDQSKDLAQDGNYKEAKAKLRQASKLDSKNVDLDKLETEAKQSAAQTLAKQGLNLAKNGKIKEARNQIKQAHKLDPDSVDLDKLNEEVYLLMKNSK